MSPSISVVVPCRDAAGLIGRQLGALARQRADAAWEVVVADNGSADGTADAAAAWTDRFPSLRVVDAGAEPGVNRARNAGVRASTGAAVVLCDADDEVGDGWLAAHVAAFAAGATLVGGPLDKAALNPWLRPVPPPMTGFADRYGFLPAAEGANCGFLRSVYDEIGGFDESFVYGGEEVEFFWRAQLAGYELTFVPGAAVGYALRSRVCDELRQYVAYGRAHAHLYRRFRDAGMPRRPVPTAARTWLAVARTPHHLADPARRRAAVRRLGLAWGRATGSVRHRVVYL